VKNPLSLPQKVHKILGECNTQVAAILLEVNAQCNRLALKRDLLVCFEEQLGSGSRYGAKTQTKIIVEQVCGFFLGKKPWKNHGKTESLFLQCNSAKA